MASYYDIRDAKAAEGEELEIREDVRTVVMRQIFAEEAGLALHDLKEQGKHLSYQLGWTNRILFLLVLLVATYAWRHW